jgi:hypothetical protein
MPAISQFQIFRILVCRFKCKYRYTLVYEYNSIYFAFLLCQTEYKILTTSEKRKMERKVLPKGQELTVS